MENPMTPVPKDHPLMIAWEAYRDSLEYVNTLGWAITPKAHLADVVGTVMLDFPHVEGSLWAAFEHGWRAALQSKTPPDAVPGITSND